jgi:hypothetical protein
VDVRLIPYNKEPNSNNAYVTDDTFSHPTCLDLMVPCQVTNNPTRADELLKRADDVEEATTSNAHKVDTKTRLVLMGRGDSAESMREMVRLLEGGLGTLSLSALVWATMPRLGRTLTSVLCFLGVNRLEW